jgi:hypothetical protein
MRKRRGWAGTIHQQKLTTIIWQERAVSEGCGQSVQRCRPAIEPDARCRWGSRGALACTRRLRADDVPVGISAKDHAAGLAASLANLATYLEE